MRLKKFNRNEQKLKKAIIILSICLVVSVLISVSMTYAVYQKTDEVLFINARVGEFKENDIQLAMKLDGEQVDTPPEKNNLYTVTVDCDNATGSWDMNEWLAKIGNITAGKVKCEVNFYTPKPTLTEVTATPDKTSINLSFTASGIGTSTTCVYGTEEGNYTNSVEEVQNTSCNITGLDMGTTYYYKVCAKNGAGEVCKEGSKKTEYKLAEHVKIGDYISMTPTATSYRVSDTVTGYTGTSPNELNPSELNLWRIIKVNSDGTVEMVSDKVSGGIYFEGKTGYMKFISTLNTIAAQYTDRVHVQSARHIGYSEQTGSISKTSMLSKTSTPSGFRTSSPSQWIGCDTDSYLCGKRESEGAGDIGYESDYNLVNDVYGSMKAYNPGGSSASYWLASRFYNYTGGQTWNFEGRYVNDGGFLGVGELYTYYNGYYGKSKYSGIRPIVVLKSASEISSGLGTSTEPYTLA